MLASLLPLAPAPPPWHSSSLDSTGVEYKGLNIDNNDDDDDGDDGDDEVVCRRPLPVVTSPCPPATD